MIEYLDFDLELADHVRDTVGAEHFMVRVAESPAGEQRRAEAVRVSFDASLRESCRALRGRELDLAGLVRLGARLGDLLLPPAARAYYERSLAAVHEPARLRLRLKLDAWSLADIPWEFSWLPPGGVAPGPESPPDPSGFLALNSRLSLARYELLSEPVGRLEPVPGRRLRLVALLAAPTDPNWPALDLAVEADELRQALADRPEVELDLRAGGTVEELQQALEPGAHIFHFAGHGRFEVSMGRRLGSVEGKGFLILRGADGRAAEVAVDTLVINLRGRGVRLAVLSACEGARRDAENPWTGIAPALLRGGLPAVVAMQATVLDGSALAFSEHFYQALAGGEPIDAAVQAGRLAIFNKSPGERDWGVPVLYLRAQSGVLFPVESDEESLQKPLGVPGWINVGLSTAAAALLIVASYLFAYPRVPDSWLVGSGISLAAVGSGALGWLLWLAGDDLRAACRRLLRRRSVMLALGIALAVLAVATGVLLRTRPAVLRVVPGTRLMTLLPKPGEPPGVDVYSLRVWQGTDEGAEPAWQVPGLGRPGVALGASPRVSTLALARANDLIAGGMAEYLAERQVPERFRADWIRRWSLAADAGENPGGRRRQAGAPLRFELLKNGQPVPLKEPKVKPLTTAVEETVEMVFLEPADAP